MLSMNPSRSQTLDKPESVKRKREPWNLRVLALVIIVFAGFLVRVTALSKTSISQDEPLHVYAATSLLETGEPNLPSGRAYTRALWFTELVALSFSLFGVNEFAARFPSVIFGTLSIILIFFMGRRFFGTAVGLISALMLAIAPFEVIWSRTSRMYAMYQFFFLLAAFAFYVGFEAVAPKNKHYRASRSPHRLIDILPVMPDWVGNSSCILVSILALYIAFQLHPLTAILYISLFCYSFSMLTFTGIREGLPKALQSKYAVFLLIVISAAVVGLTFSNIPERIMHISQFSPDFANKTGKLYYYRFLMSPYRFPVGAFFVLGIMQICVRRHKGGFYLVICTGVPLVFHSFFAHIQRPRYIFDVFPLVVLIASYGIYNVYKNEWNIWFSKMMQPRARRFSKQVSQALVICLFAVVLLPIGVWVAKLGDILGGVPNYSYGGMFHSDYKKACQYVVTKAHYDHDRGQPLFLAFLEE